MLTPQIVYATNEAGQRVIVPEKLTMIAVIYGILAAFFYLLCYKMTTERVIVPTKKAEKSGGSFLKTYGQLLICRPLLTIIAIALVLLIGSLLTQTMNTYLYKDYFNNTSILSLVSMASLLPMLLCAPFATKLSAKFGKKEVCTCSMLVAACVFFLLWILKLKNPMVYILMTVISGTGLGMLNMLIWAFIGDVIDYQEIHTGERIDGTVYSLYSFARKVGQALAGGIGGFTLTLVGYVSSTEGISQTQEVKNGIYTCSTLVPAICYLVVFLLLLLVYPLGKKQVDENVSILAEKRAGK
jgi:GPH family glycoside/pentoside/hexuronide:cation symporter